MLTEKNTVFPWAGKLEGLSANISLASMVFNGISQNSNGQVHYCPPSGI